MSQRRLLASAGAAPRLAAELVVPHGRRERLLLALARGPVADVVTRALSGGRVRADGAAVARIEAALHRVGRAPAGWVALADPGDAARGRVVALLPGDGGRRVGEVLKLRRRRVGGPGLEREAEALQWAHRRLSDDLRAAIPSVLARATTEDDEVLLLSVVDGRPQDRDLQAAWRPRALAARHGAAAMDWLVRFQRASAREEPMTGDSLRDIEVRLGDSGDGWSRVESARRRLPEWRRVLDDLRLPGCAAHGDYWPRNVLASGGLVTGVVDWEAFEARADPLRDPFHYAVAAALRLGDRRRDGRGRAFRALLRGEAPVIEGLSRWARAFDVPRAAWGPLFETWIVRHGAAVAGGETEAIRWFEETTRGGRSAFSG